MLAIVTTDDPNPYAAPSAELAVDPRQIARSDARWALVAAIVSVFFCAPLTAPFALYKANRALKVGPSDAAVGAVFLAVVGLVTSAIFMALAVWQYLDPAPPR